MDYQFIAFVFLAIVIITYGPMFFYRQNKMAAAFIFFILAILVMTFYGIRWFSGDKMNLGPASLTGSWPPYVNVCPDYLTYYEGTIGKGCINKTATAIGTLQAITGPAPTSTGQLFNHKAAGAQPSYATYDIENKEAACMKAREMGLTWEGITNGDSCTF
jgi:hypothetical protein